MKKIFLTFFVVCVICNAFGQNNKKDQDVDIVNHEVQLGESIRLISKKYLVDPAEIYKRNKFAVEGISQGMILKIPIPRKAGSQPETTESLNNQEPVVTEPIAETPPTPHHDIKKIVITERKIEINHQITAKETLYSLAKDFNVSVDELKASNPEVAKRGLQIGQTIVIPKEKSVDIQQSTSLTELPLKAVPDNNEQEKQKNNQAISEPSTGNMIRHKVEPKETLYSLSKKYNVSPDEIKQQNETVLKHGLQIGQILMIRTNN